MYRVILTQMRVKIFYTKFSVGLTKLKSLQNKSVFIASLFTEDEMVLRNISNSFKKTIKIGLLLEKLHLWI